MIITFNELRELKDKLPNGSMKKIADKLDIEEDTVRNYFGGTHSRKEKAQVLAFILKEVEMAAMYKLMMTEYWKLQEK